MKPGNELAAGQGRVEFVLFVVVGGMAAVVNILSRIALSLAISYEVAILLAYACGMTTAFVLNKIFVFAVSGRRAADEYVRFALVNLAAVVQVWLVSVALARLVFPAIGLVWHAETIAHFAGVLVPVATSYFGHKHFSFAPKKR